MYDHVDVVEEKDADVLIQTVKNLRLAVLEFLNQNYPQRLPSSK